MPATLARKRIAAAVLALAALLGSAAAAAHALAAPQHGVHHVLGDGGDPNMKHRA